MSLKEDPNIYKIEAPPSAPSPPGGPAWHDMGGRATEGMGALNHVNVAFHPQKRHAYVVYDATNG
jgi:hypothetical protein